VIVTTSTLCRFVAGDLYGEGKTDSKEPIRAVAGTRVKIVYDADAGTLTYFVNDKYDDRCDLVGRIYEDVL
jgi:hypothetical protein